MKRRQTALLSVAVLAVAALPFLTDDRFLIKVLTFVGINVVVVTGLALLFGYAGQVSLGHAAFVGIGAYTSAYLTAHAAWPWPASVLAAVALSVAGGLLLALPSLRLRGHYLAMATLGFGEIMQIAFVEAEPVTGGVDGMRVPPAVVGGVDLSQPLPNYLLVWAVAAVCLVLAYNLVVRRPGRAMLAMHGSEEGASACGIDLVRLKVQVFALSAALAGLAGALFAQRVGFVSPSQYGLSLSIALVAMAVLGGSRSLAGPAAAAALLTLLPFIDAVVPGLPRAASDLLAEWEEAVYGLAIIGVMLFAPGGLAGAAKRSARLLRGAAAGDDRAEGGGGL